MRRVLRGIRDGCCCSCHTLFCFAALRCFFVVLGACAERDLSVAIHHCVKAITASGSPIRNPRCGTSKVETALPQRHVVSGIIVNEGGRSISTPKRPPSFEPAFSKSSFQPKPPFSSTING